jgi:porin-like protein
MSLITTTHRLAAGLLLAASTAQLASAEIRYEYGAIGSAVLYGQLTPAYQIFDDGVSRTKTLVDNASSNTRVGVWLRQPLGTNKLAFNFETAIGLRQSSLVTQGFTPSALDWKRTSIRKFEVILRTENAGTFSLGQGSMAGDGVAKMDLSGTTLVTYSAIPDVAGAFRFRNADGSVSNKTIAGSFSDLEAGRLFRMRYDTPKFHGISFSVSYGKQVLVKNANFKSYGAAMRYDGEFGDTKLIAAIGYSHSDLATGGQVDSTFGSFSLLHASGISVTVASGHRNQRGNYIYGKLGHQSDWLDIGKTAVSVDFYRGNDRSSDGAKSTSYGLGIVQKFDAAHIEAYLGLRSYELTETNASFLDASSTMFGMRWKF